MAPCRRTHWFICYVDLPRNVYCQTRMTQVVRAIPKRSSSHIHIYIEDFARGNVRKMTCPCAFISFEVGLVCDEVVEPRKVFRFALLFCSWEVSVYSCSVHPTYFDGITMIVLQLPSSFLWMLIDIYRSRGYSALGLDVMSSTQKKWLGRRRRLSQKQGKQSHDWGYYRHTSAMVEICSDPRLLFQVDLVLEHSDWCVPLRCFKKVHVEQWR